jgi:prepilin-type N-terminal cleavage/methylation domain-containing protein
MSNTNNTTKNGSTNHGTKRGGRRRGFTLIEILIVVVILGVLAALVIPGVTGAMSDANNSAAVARASQITTMVTRLNQFKPGGATITLTDGTEYSATDLNALVPAKYCSAADLANQLDSGKGWVWSDSENKFTPAN